METSGEPHTGAQTRSGARSGDTRRVSLELPCNMATRPWEPMSFFYRTHMRNGAQAAPAPRPLSSSAT